MFPSIVESSDFGGGDQNKGSNVVQPHRPLQHRRVCHLFRATSGHCRPTGGTLPYCTHLHNHGGSSSLRQSCGKFFFGRETLAYTYSMALENVVVGAHGCILNQYVKQHILKILLPVPSIGYTFFPPTDK